MRALFRPVLAVALLVWGCTPATSPSPSVQPSTSPSEAAVGGLPPGCEPIDLRDSAGTRVDLDGVWTEVATPDRVDLMTWWIYALGNCVWGAGYVDEVEVGGMSATPEQVQSLNGHIQSDFTITGEIHWLGPASPQYSTLRMFIEFDDAGEIILREDREPGVRGPRCPEPQGFCPDPLVLQRAD